jgi:phosphoglycerate dehydrogenase-like enzyme
MSGMCAMRIAVLDDYQNIALQLADWSAIAARTEITVFNRHLSEEDAVEALKPFDIICLLRERMAMPSSLIERLPNLKFIAVTGPHNRTLDLAAAVKKGIVVSNTLRRGAAAFVTAELAWGLILSLLRHIPHEAAQMRTGGWQTTLGSALGGRTLGVLGLGRLGSHMVPIGKAFGMEVIAWSQNMTAEGAAAKGALRVEKDELFARSDVLSLHLVLSERTYHIVGARELALMKPTAYLVNTSRGPLIDKAALLKALSERRIAGAGLDTFDEEPLPDDDPLRKQDNVVLTPHLGYTVRDLLQVFYEDVVENIIAFLNGKPIHLMDKP